jgi:hypothetical protein
MNHCVSVSLTNRKSSVHLYALYSPRTALRTFTPRRVQLVNCGQYWHLIYSSAGCFLSGERVCITGFLSSVGFLIGNPSLGRLGGVLVSVLATGPKGREFRPGQGYGFLRAIKIRSTPSFGWEVRFYSILKIR